jgi:Family of unknown function (DUF6188)
MTNEATELADRWILPLRGDTVTRIEPGEQTVFVLDSDVRIIVGEHAYFTEGPITGPEVERTELGQHDQGALAKSVGAQVLSAVGFKNGALRVVLSSAWHLNVTRSQPLVPAAVVSGETVLWIRTMPSAGA